MEREGGIGDREGGIRKRERERDMKRDAKVGGRERDGCRGREGERGREGGIMEGRRHRAKGMGRLMDVKWERAE